MRSDPQQNEAKKRVSSTNWGAKGLGYVDPWIGEIGLQRRIQILMALGLLVIFTFFWLAGRRVVEESARHSLDHQLAMAGLVASLLDNRLETALTLLEATADQSDLSGGNELAPPRTKLLRDAQLQLSTFGRRLFWLDTNGQILWTEPFDPSQLGRPFIDFETIYPAVEKEDSYISNLCLSSNSARPYILLAVPVIQPTGVVDGLLVEEVETDQLGLENILKQVAPGNKAYIQVIDSGGIILASSASNHSLQKVDHTVQFSRLIDNRQPMVGRCHQCHPGGSGEDRDTTRTDEVLAFAPLNTVRWGVAIRQPASEVAAPVIQLRQQILLGGGVVLVVALLVTSWFIGRQIIGPLQIVDRASVQWASGNLNVSIPNVGIDEVAQLAANLEQMRSKLDATLEDQRRWNEALSEMVEERTHELAVLYEQVESKEVMCRRLLGKVLTTQEEERARLARELHDAIGQALTAIIMTTTAVENSLPDDFTNDKEKLTNVRAVATHALQDLRNLIFDLRPEILDDLGLALALRSQVKKHLEPAGVEVRLRAAGLKDQLPPDVERAIFRVVQEAITNIARHAQATEAKISLSIKEGRLIVRVEDNGVGFEPDRVMGGQRQAWGLYGMKERITLLGGTLYVGSKPGDGTLLLAEIPL